MPANRNPYTTVDWQDAITEIGKEAKEHEYDDTEIEKPVSATESAEDEKGRTEETVPESPEKGSPKARRNPIK